MHKKNRKGFTLIELLAVIAIIAILVSIMTPLAIKYTSKANAATNAANMRSVKATVATMLVSGQIDPESGNNADRVSSSLQDKIDTVDDSTITGWFIKLFLEGLEPLISFVLSDNTTFYAENGILTIDGNTIAAPEAKRIDVDGIVVRAGTEMTLTFVKSAGTNGYDDIVITYDGVPIEVFAVIAADGDEAKISNISHNFIDTNTDWVCDICGKDMESHSTEEIIGGLGSNTHKCTDDNHDHLCDDADCKQWVAAHYDSPSDGDHICDASSACKNTSAIEGCSDSTTDGDHNCDICGKSGVSAHTYVNGTCECGAVEPSCAHVDNKGDTSGCSETGDGYCDNCGATMN